MKLINTRAGWITEGMLITILAAKKPVDDKCLATYYGLSPGDRHYDEQKRASKYTRVVLMRPTGAFVIVPMTPHTVEVPSG